MTVTAGTSTARSTGWFPVARATEVGTTPVPVGAGGRPFVVVRLRPGGEVSAYPARCPHRLVPLATATVTEGRLQCPAHGWLFDSEGRCADVPSLGATGTPPPPAGPVFGNLDPSLEHAWHPVALSRELRPGGWLQVRLLARNWTLRREGSG